MQTPQVRIQKHGVELCTAALLEQFGESRHISLEDFRRDLAATGQLRPEPRIRSSRHDLRVDGCRGHTTEQNWRAPSQLGELRLDTGLIPSDQTRCKLQPRCRMLNVALRQDTPPRSCCRSNHRYAIAFRVTFCQLDDACVRPQIQNGGCPLVDEPPYLGAPVTGVHQDCTRKPVRRFRIQPNALSSLHYPCHSRCQRWVMECAANWQNCTFDFPPLRLLRCELLCQLVQFILLADNYASGLRILQTDDATLWEQRFQLLNRQARDAHHRRAPKSSYSASARTRDTDEASKCNKLCCLRWASDNLSGKNTLRMTGYRYRFGDINSLLFQQLDNAQLCQDDARDADRRVGCISGKRLVCHE